MKFKIFSVALIFGIIYIWLGDAYSHQGESHKKHIDERIETHAEPHTIEQNTSLLPMSAPSPHEGHKHPQKVETGAFNLIQIGKKEGYNTAIIFTGFIAVIWGVVSFYWRDRR